jgi:signal transduction histidine kinase
VKQRLKTIPSRRATATRIRGGGEIERFESLVDELSAAIARASASRVDDEIQLWLAKICLALGLDRSAIYERDAPGQPLRTTHTWLRENFPPFPKKYDPEKLASRTADYVMAGNQLVFSNPAEIPFELSDAKRFVDRYGPKASAVIPMFAGDRVIGAASFGRFRSPREWHPRLLQQLAFVVRIFGRAIERKQAAIAAQAARAELAVAQRRSIAGELVGSLTHELNQPLAAILSNLEGAARLLSQGAAQPSIVYKAVKNAIRDAKRAGEIVRRIRGIFKGGETRKTAVNLHSLAQATAELMRNEAAFRRTTLRIDDSLSVPSTLADPLQIQQCIMNLLMNAVDATSQVKTGPREVTIRIAPERTGWIGLSVCDTGAGVAPAIASRVFEPFATTKPNGMGLGLLVTKSIIEGHGGRVWFNPNPDRGTTFTFTLPIAHGNRAETLQTSE